MKSPEQIHDIAGHAMEAAVPASERHGRGQYFTPEPLIERVLDLVDAPGSGCMVLDPACGSGRFLSAARRRWALDGACLRGVDSDPAALAIARAELSGAELIVEDFLAIEGRGDVDLLIGNPPYVRDRGHKADLYLRFLLEARHHLRPGGQLALVLSNAWLDVGYGQQVRDLLLDHFVVQWVVQSTVERWFPGAKIHTMILVAQREDDPARRFAAPRARFVTLDAPLSNGAKPTLRRSIPQADLPRSGPWGPLLRAPQIYLDLLAQGELVPLGELATLERGYTTNDNAFFYPPGDAGIEEPYLRPLLRSPKRVRTLRAAASELPDRVFLCDLERAELAARGHRGALAWIENHRPGAAAASYRIRPQRPARLFLVKGYASCFRQPLLDAPTQADQQLTLVRPRGVSVLALAAVMNSSWFHLSLEQVGRVNFGDGVLWLGLKDARSQLRLPDLRLISQDRLRSLIAAYEALPDGPVPNAARLFADPAWGAAQDRLDREVGALLGLLPLQLHLVRQGWQEATAMRLRMGKG